MVIKYPGWGAPAVLTAGESPAQYQDPSPALAFEMRDIRYFRRQFRVTEDDILNFFFISPCEFLKLLTLSL